MRARLKALRAFQPGLATASLSIEYGHRLRENKKYNNKRKEKQNKTCMHPKARRKSDIQFLYSLVSNSMLVSSLDPSLITQLLWVWNRENTGAFRGQFIPEITCRKNGNGLRETMKKMGVGGQRRRRIHTQAGRKQKRGKSVVESTAMHEKCIKEMMPCMFFNKRTFRRDSAMNKLFVTHRGDLKWRNPASL